jgi:hypothetical protein
MSIIENNRLLVGEEYGKIDVICLDTMQVLLSSQLKNEEHINEIKKMSRAQEYGFATSLGLRFGKVIEDSKGKVQFVEDDEDYFLAKKWIQSLFEMIDDKIIVCVHGSSTMYIICRVKNSVIKKIRNPSYHLVPMKFYEMGQYDPRHLPYLFLKD